MDSILLSIVLCLLLVDRYEKIRDSLKARRELEKAEIEKVEAEIEKRARDRINDEQKKFLLTETKLIEMSKWIESEKAHKDLTGNDFVADWIRKHAKDVRTAWENSKCRTCTKECRHNLRETCPEHQIESN